MNRTEFKQEGEAIMASVNHHMEAIFGAPLASAIEEATVFSETLPHDNYTFKRKFYGRDKALVVARAKRMVDEMDYMCSPHASCPVFQDGNWVVIVTWYSVD